METVRIPEYRDLKKQIDSCVDKFSDHTLSITSVLRLQRSGHSVELKFNHIKDKILNRNDVKSNGLFGFLAYLTEEFATSKNKGTSSGDLSNTDSKKKSGANTPDRKEFSKSKTLDKSFKEKLKEEIDNIEKVKKNHDVLIEELIKKQKVIWEITAQVNKPSSSKTELLELLDKTKEEYLKMVANEVNISDKLIKATESTEMKVVQQITAKLSDSLAQLSCLIKDFIPNEKVGIILRRINNIDVNAVAGEIYQSCCVEYKYIEPAEYFRQINFDEHLLETPQTSKPRKLNIKLDIYEFDAQFMFSYQAKFSDKEGSNKLFRLREFFRKKFGIKTKYQKKTKPPRDIIAEHRILTLLAIVFLQCVLEFYRSAYLEDVYEHYMKLLPKFANRN